VINHSASAYADAGAYVNAVAHRYLISQDRAGFYFNIVAYMNIIAQLNCIIYQAISARHCKPSLVSCSG
jgi:hypothetical protein